MEYIPHILSLLSVIVAGGAVYVSYHTVSKQVKLQEKIKLADLRQDWIHQLREAMAEFQSFGMTPDLNHKNEKDFYKHGTKIELLMNKDDKDYSKLQECMYNMLQASSLEEKYEANPEYIKVCQRIIKREWEVLKKELQEIKSKKL